MLYLYNENEVYLLLALLLFFFKDNIMRNEFLLYYPVVEYWNIESAFVDKNSAFQFRIQYIFLIKM